MNVKEIQIPPLSLTFQIEKNERKLYIPKSHTNVQYADQLKLITNTSDFFVPLTIEELDENYLFVFQIPSNRKTWQEIKQLPKSEKLRMLCNLQKLEKISHSRLTFFLHPNNIIFDENLMPEIVHRGAENLVEPFEMNEQDLLKQYKCMAIALFSSNYSYDSLYQGSLEKTGKNEFERQIKAKKTITELFSYLKENYRIEQKQTDQIMAFVPKKHFYLYKQLTIWLSIITVLVAGFLIYVTLYIIPYQDRLMEAQNHYLADNYGGVIQTLKNEKVKKLPYHTKYILANSYIKAEKLSDKEKASVMKNIDLKSDPHYLEYWIYNGLGEFDESIDLAKYMDDPRLIMYGIIKKIEQVKNDPELTGSEKEEEAKRLREELDTFTEEYELLEENDQESSGGNIQEKEIEDYTKDEPEEKAEDKEEKKAKQKEKEKAKKER